MANLSEREAKRYNKNLERIFEGKKFFDNAYADFLIKKGYSPIRVKELRDSDKLGYEIHHNFTNRDSHSADFLSKIIEDYKISQKKVVFAPSKPPHIENSEGINRRANLIKKVKYDIVKNGKVIKTLTNENRFNPNASILNNAINYAKRSRAEQVVEYVDGSRRCINVELPKKKFNKHKDIER